jgi:hypothetical protein
MNDIMILRNIPEDSNYFVINKESKAMLSFNTLEEIKENLAGDLDKDWIIYSKTTYIDELKKLGVDIDLISKRCRPNVDKIRLRKLGI